VDGDRIGATTFGPTPATDGSGEAMTGLEDIRAMVQQAINDGATTVEEVHKNVAAMPFQTLKNVQGMGDVGQSMEDMTNLTIGTVYDTIRQVNDQVHQVAKQMLEASGTGGGTGATSATTD
jgi:hypothetical protein